MKKLALFSALALTIGAMSCTKDYTCSCTFVEPFFGTTMNVDTMFIDVKKGEAEDECDKVQSEIAILDPEADCNLD